MNWNNSGFINLWSKTREQDSTILLEKINIIKRRKKISHFSTTNFYGYTYTSEALLFNSLQERRGQNVIQKERNVILLLHYSLFIRDSKCIENRRSGWPISVTMEKLESWSTCIRSGLYKSQPSNLFITTSCWLVRDQFIKIMEV